MNDEQQYTPRAGRLCEEILDSLEDCYWLVDARVEHFLRIILLNRSAARYLKLARDRATGRPLNELLSAELAAPLAQQVLLCCEQDQVRHFEQPFGLSTGRQLFDIRLVPLPNRSGRVRWVAILARDLTEHRRRQQTLPSREQEFRALVEHSPASIARYDRRCRRIYANPAFADLAGADVPMLLNKTPEEFPGGPAAIAYQGLIQEVLAGGESREMELPWRNDGGSEICTLIRSEERRVGKECAD